MALTNGEASEERYRVRLLLFVKIVRRNGLKRCIRRREESIDHLVCPSSPLSSEGGKLTCQEGIKGAVLLLAEHGENGFHSMKIDKFQPRFTFHTLIKTV